MTALPLPDNLASDPSWLVQAIDPRARLARLVKMDAEAYREASFLDDRLLAQDRESRLCSLDDLVAMSGDAEGPPTSWIFHIGHVGSTLVSRLLGELPEAIALREPRSLRDLAVADAEELPMLARALDRLMGRRDSNHQAVIVKATSFVSEYAALLTRVGSKALFLFASPANYIAGILAGENSLKELMALHDTRVQRLDSRGIDLRGFAADNAHRAAAAWACEMTSLEAAAEAMADRNIFWADFDVMLRDMPGWLEQLAGHFGLYLPADRATQLAAGPLMRRYSKALEYDYSPSLREELLTEAMNSHGRRIEAALVALEAAAKQAPLLQRAVKRARRES